MRTLCSLWSSVTISDPLHGYSLFLVLTRTVVFFDETFLSPLQVTFPFYRFYSLISVVTNVSAVVDMSNPSVAPVLVMKAGPPIAKGSPPIGAT